MDRNRPSQPHSLVSKKVQFIWKLNIYDNKRFEITYVKILTFFLFETLKGFPTHGDVIPRREEDRVVRPAILLFWRLNGTPCKTPQLTFKTILK